MDRREALKTAAGLASMALIPLPMLDAGTSHPAQETTSLKKWVDSTPESRYTGAILQKLDDFFIANHHKLYYENGAESLMQPAYEMVMVHPEEVGVDSNKCKCYCLELAASYLSECQEEYERNAHLMTYVKSS
jgi:hypothetical protein